MLENGHIKLYRSLTAWEWYDDINTCRLFIHLLLMANWKDDKWHGETVKRGQKITSYDKLSKETGLTVQQVRTAIKKLKSTGEITVESTSKFSVITVNNYNNYQHINTPFGTQAAGGQQPYSKQTTTNEERKNARKKEGKSIPFTPYENFDKKKRADFVYMTDDEYSALIEKVGKQGEQRCVEILDNYKGASGRKYKSDYRAILNWVTRRYKEEMPQNTPSETPNTPSNPFLREDL